MAWVRAIRGENWSPSAPSRVCSDHFEQDCFERRGKLVRLLWCANPSLCIPTEHDLEEEDRKRSEESDRKRILKEHNYHIPLKKLKSESDKMKKERLELKNKLRVKKQSVKRLKRKVKSMKCLVKELRDKSLISTNAEEHLGQKFSVVSLELMKRSRFEKKGKKFFKYSNELKCFAMTLIFYSTKAYEYVRRNFNLNLPHQATIRKWYSKIPADPGFTKPAFSSLQNKEGVFIKSNIKCRNVCMSGYVLFIVY